MVAKHIFIKSSTKPNNRYEISKSYQYRIFYDPKHYLVCIKTLQYWYGIGPKIIKSVKTQMQSNGNNTGFYSFKQTKYKIKPKQWLIDSEKTELDNCTHSQRHYVKKCPNSTRISREMKDGKVFNQWQLYLLFQKTYHPEAYEYWLLKQKYDLEKKKKNPTVMVLPRPVKMKPGFKYWSRVYLKTYNVGIQRPYSDRCAIHQYIQSNILKLEKEIKHLKELENNNNNNNNNIENRDLVRSNNKLNKFMELSQIHDQQVENSKLLIKHSKKIAKKSGEKNGIQPIDEFNKYKDGILYVGYDLAQKHKSFYCNVNEEYFTTVLNFQTMQMQTYPLGLKLAVMWEEWEGETKSNNKLSCLWWFINNYNNGSSILHICVDGISKITNI